MILVTDTTGPRNFGTNATTATPTASAPANDQQESAVEVWSVGPDVQVQASEAEADDGEHQADLGDETGDAVEPGDADGGRLVEPVALEEADVDGDPRSGRGNGEVDEGDGELEQRQPGEGNRKGCSLQTAKALATRGTCPRTSARRSTPMLAAVIESKIDERPTLCTAPMSE